jgi:hypothetical protein
MRVCAYLDGSYCDTNEYGYRLCPVWTEYLEWEDCPVYGGDQLMVDDEEEE